MKKKEIIKNILCILATLLCLISLGVFSYYTFKLNLIPTKYIVVGYIVTIVLIGVLVFNLFRKSKLVTKIISSVFLVLISIIFIIGIKFLNNTYHFLDKTQVSYDTLTYSVVVKKENDYSKIKDLNNKKIAYIDDKYKNDIKKNLNKKIKFDKKISDASNIYSELLNNEVDAICLEEGYLTLANEEIEDFKSNTKIIYTFKVKVKAYKEKSKIKVNKEPFVLYISGIDQYGNVNTIRGRSDVNQIMVINPKTHHILMVNTPRDYYVQLTGTTGLRDKLTHAGIYGIDKSITTLESIYDVDINHYVRINFDSLIKVVDLIGGVDINSDRSFRCWTNKSVTVKKGWNHFNGKEALAYSRERLSYVDGDNHRGRNQQQVIEAIIKKLTTSDEIIKNYNSILNSLEGSFQTDIPVETITAFINYQLDEMPSWKIDTVQANGYSSWGYTYSMGYNYYLWVMEPDWGSVNKIKIKIKDVLNEA